MAYYRKRKIYKGKRRMYKGKRKLTIFSGRQKGMSAYSAGDDCHSVWG